jgi:anti-sigma-K factor RskA
MSNDQKTAAITEAQLILYYYDDGLSPTEKQAITAALQTDALLAVRYRELSASLVELQDETPVAAPAHLKPQWHELIGREAQLERQRSVNTGRSRHWLGWAAGLATMLVVGIAIGIWMQPTATPPDAGEGGLVQVVPELAAPEGGIGAFTRAVQFYLDGQQAELAGMDDRQAETNQLILLQIIAQNRLIERAAVANQAPELARLMRAFEPVLLKLADPATSPEQAAALQRQLAFEMQAVLTKLQQAPSKPATII